MINMAVYFSSFTPLCSTKAGKNAIQLHKLKPFIDGSCRREPDFENQFPSITGLCRPTFSRKLSVGDIVIYGTNIFGIKKRKIVAILIVTAIKIDHIEAAEWYRINKLPIPNNVFDSETKPFPMEKTHQHGGFANVVEWNLAYESRKDEFSNVAICQVLNNYLFLDDPIEIDSIVMHEIFGKTPGTQNPYKLRNNEWCNFQRWLDDSIEFRNQKRN
jgi:hypothetical protein